MEIELIRRANIKAANGKDGYCIGDWVINGKVICHNLEDEDRGLTQDMSAEQIGKLKKKGRTAIPKGRYKVNITRSPRFNRDLPILVDVPGYAGVRIHSGNTAGDTEGCLLPGMNTVKGEVRDSRKWTAIIISHIKNALNKGEEVWITIK